MGTYNRYSLMPNYNDKTRLFIVKYIVLINSAKSIYSSMKRGSVPLQITRPFGHSQRPILTNNSTNLPMLTSCQHPGKNKPTQDSSSSLRMSRLDSQTSQATCPTGHNTHTPKETQQTL